MEDRQTAVIGVKTLAELLGREDVVVADCRFSLADAEQGAREYAAGHVPGAWHLDLNRHLSSPVGKHGGRHPLPDVARLSARLGEMGVRSGAGADQSLVVAYDDSRLAFAARLWWLLRYLGHTRVCVLDGGFRAWKDERLPVETAVPAPRAGRFVAEPRPERVVGFEQVRRIVAGGTDAVLVDSREAERYAGVREPIDPVAGHIPGALNFPWPEVTDADGFVRDAEFQRRRWARLPSGRGCVVYCGSGVTACVNLLSLHLAGAAAAKLYAGSWSDWCSHDGEVRTGEAP